MSATTADPTPSTTTRAGPWHWIAVAALLVLAAGLSIDALLGDSLTYDELDHLTGGMSKLKTGDFRLAPGNPPLGQVWAALPLLFLDHKFPGPDADGWRDGRVWRIGHKWLYELNSDGERLVSAARGMSVVLLLATCLCIYAAARTLFGPAAGLLALALAALSPELKAHGHLVTADLPVTFCFTLVLLTFARLMERISIPRLLAAALALAALSVVKFSWPLVLPALLAMALHALIRARPIELAWWNSLVPANTPQSAADASPLVACACGYRNRRLASFCGRCGQPVSGGAGGTLVCRCRHENVADANFCESCGRRVRQDSADATVRGIRNRLVRGLALAAVGAVLAASIWAGVWTAYLWRFSPFAGVGRDEATMAAVSTSKNVSPKNMDEAWDVALKDTKGEPLKGATADFLRWSHERKLLPEAYLYGLALVLRPSENRNHYLNGEIYSEIRASYFPTAFALKTPIGTAILLGLGVAAIAVRWPIRRGQNLLARGMYVFILFYVPYLMFNAVNIGHRHLLPVYPALIVLASAAATWLVRPLDSLGATWTAWRDAVKDPALEGGRRRAAAILATLLIGGPLAWLAYANYATHPHYLGYFNEIAGGARNGWHYLADSNLDWGQDVKRLAAYAKAHPGEKIKLAYFGTAKPDKYGFEVEMLPSAVTFGQPAVIEPGTYVLSITQALGVYAQQLRDSFWAEAKVQDAYKKGWERVSKPPAANEPEQMRQFRSQFDQLRAARLISRLCAVPPDDTIGCSMWVYRLSQSDVDEMTKP